MFETVVGHERALAILRRSLEADAVAAGYLFTGPAGVGKRLVAEQFARAVLCEAAVRPCGTCRSCRLPAGAPHPDLIRCSPAEGRKQIVVDQVREFCGAISLSPAWGARRAAVIEPADAMNTAAANALLKTLEEPPPGRTMILVTARPGGLPPTVLSRCRRVSFGLLADGEVAAVLRAAGGWPEGAARQAAVLAEGSPGGAVARDGKAWQGAEGVARSLAAALAAGDRGGLLAAAEAAREREASLLAVQVLLAWLRTAARAAAGAGGAEPPPELAGLGEETATRLLERALAVHRRLDANANAKLAFTAFAVGDHGEGIGR